MPGNNGITTARLIEQWGTITGRGKSDGYQFIAFANGLVYESFRWTCNDDTSIWLPWSRRPCHSVVRLARLTNATVEFA
jgi:hypothetical protein